MAVCCLSTLGRKGGTMNTTSVDIRGLTGKPLRIAQDSNLQVVSNQRFSRPLPHRPDTILSLIFKLPSRTQGGFTVARGYIRKPLARDERIERSHIGLEPILSP